MPKQLKERLNKTLAALLDRYCYIDNQRDHDECWRLLESAR